MKGPVDFGHKPDGRGDGGGHYSNNHQPSFQQQQGMNDGNEFAEFLWMGEENLEDFDRQCELEFWEEQFIESCFEEMLQEEQGIRQGQQPVGQPQVHNGPGNHVYIPPQRNAPAPSISTPNNNSQQSSHQVPNLAGMMQGLNIEEHNQKNTVMSSSLNPDAPVFVPRGVDIRNSADR